MQRVRLKRNVIYEGKVLTGRVYEVEDATAEDWYGRGVADPADGSSMTEKKTSTGKKPSARPVTGSDSDDWNGLDTRTVNLLVSHRLTPAQVAGMTAEDLQEYKGIADKTAEKIKAAV